MLDPEDPQNSFTPERVHEFHTLFPLDSNVDENGTPMIGSLSCSSRVFKAVSQVDGNTYALRKLDGERPFVPFLCLSTRTNPCLPFHLSHHPSETPNHFSHDGLQPFLSVFPYACQISLPFLILRLLAPPFILSLRLSSLPVTPGVSPPRLSCHFVLMSLRKSALSFTRSLRVRKALKVGL